MPHKYASSQAAWALLTSGVSSARVEAHRLQHLVNRALKLIEQSEHKEHFYQEAGDLIQAVPQRLEQLERDLDRTSLALSKMGEQFLESRLPLHDKVEVDEAVQSTFGGGTLKHTAVDRVAVRYLISKSIDPSEVLSVRVGGSPVSVHIDNFVKLLLKEGQQVHKLVAGAVKEVESYYPPDKMDGRLWVRAVREHLKHLWGSDPMLPFLARVVAFGDFVF